MCAPCRLVPPPGGHTPEGLRACLAGVLWPGASCTWPVPSVAGHSGSKTHEGAGRALAWPPYGSLWPDPSPICPPAPQTVYAQAWKEAGVDASGVCHISLV